eukprot:5517945-Pyramimonas_sp.AAC.2
MLHHRGKVVFSDSPLQRPSTPNNQNIFGSILRDPLSSLSTQDDSAQHVTSGLHLQHICLVWPSSASHKHASNLSATNLSPQAKCAINERIVNSSL